jgi:YVTN family beta-propeller protein
MVVRNILCRAALVVVPVTLLTLPATGVAQALKPRIIQSNWAGDTLLVIDPATDKVIKEFHGLEVVHGVQSSPDGTRLYASLESDDTVAVIDYKTGKVLKRIPLSNNPNNLAITRDGKKIYVAINTGAGGVDVLDTVSLTNVKHIPLNGVKMHNVFTTDNGRAICGGSQDNARRFTICMDTQNDEETWSLEFPDPIDVIRPEGFILNPDGSTKWILQQLQHLMGFAVIDFKTHQVVQRVSIPQGPDLSLKAAFGSPLAGMDTIPTHGMSVAHDGKSLWLTSRKDASVYQLSVPDFKLIARVPVGEDPWWCNLTPDDKKLYVASQRTNYVSVVDTVTMKEIAHIPVGGYNQPKRNDLAMMVE